MFAILMASKLTLHSITMPFDAFEISCILKYYEKTLLLNSWRGTCSISAIGESNGKSQLAKYFQIPTNSRVMAG